MRQAVCSGCLRPLPMNPGRPGRPRRYCGRQCIDWAQNHPRDFRRVLRSCRGCGADISERPMHASYCKDACRPPRATKALERSCSHCGVDISARPGQAKYCSKRCNEIASGKRLPAPLPLAACALPECAATFQPWKTGQRCCSEKHSKLLYNRESRADGRQKRGPWNDKRRDSYHRRKALKKGASTGAPVRMTEIAERDRWRCHLCGTRVGKKIVWPHPRSPSLDHVVPLSKGGIHDPANVALAHLGCNTAKNNRGGGEQLMLIG